MAQQDTGLGWSAENEYLLSSGPALLGNLSKYYAEGYNNQPIAYCPTDNDVHTSGLNIGHVHVDDIYIGSQTEDAVIFVTYSGNYQYLLSTVQRFNVRICNKRNDSWVGAFTERCTGSYDSSTGLYSARITIDNSHTWTYSSDVFAYTDRGAIIKSANDPYYKLNPGYAVAGLVSWLSLAGDILTTPVLISSDREAVKLSADGTTEIADQMIADNLHDGVRFYMSFLNLRDYSFTNETVPIIDLTQFGASQPAKVFKLIVDPSIANVQISNSPDPYETESGESGEEGGNGEDTGDDDAGIEAGSDFPSAINTGFCRIFSPSESELRNLSNYLWSNSYDIAQVKKLFSNPMDSILGLSAVPIRLLGSSVSFSLGGVPITGMTLPLVTQQRYTYHMGSITIKERWGSYLDYDPYTKFSIFLPFIGMRELAADDIMGKTVGLVYDIDILTGMCVARLQAGTNCLYEWGGNCAIQLPINSRNWDSVFSTAVSAVGGIVSAVTGGSAPLVAGSVASAALQTVSMKPRIDKSSTIGGAAGWLGQMTPYIIRTTPEAYIPADQNKFIGYPAYINVSLNEISGYNEVESIHLENVTATGTELEEIESILKGGVIF